MTVTDQRIVELFGTDECLEVWKNFPVRGAARQLALATLYEKQLKKVAKHTLKFKMVVQTSRTKYFLIFASNHDLGFKKMKEVMWRTDDTGKFEYSSATHDQLTFMHVFNNHNLKDLILKEFNGKNQTEVSEIINFVIYKTDFLEKHAKQALKELETENKINVKPIKTNNEKRRKGSFPNGVIVNFINN